MTTMENGAFEGAKWIWTSEADEADEYAEFFFEIPREVYETAAKERTTLRISCDGDYTLYIGGKYVASNQYGDFEHYKIYDELDVAPYLSAKGSECKILVWHFGADTSRYAKARAGVIFELFAGENVIFQSRAGVLCRKSRAYISGFKKLVSGQLGYTFSYDATKEDDCGDRVLEAADEARYGLFGAVEVEKRCTFFPRPIEKLKIGDRVPTELISSGDFGGEKRYVFDLQRETVGLPVLEFYSKKPQKITVYWDEALKDGRTRFQNGACGRHVYFEYAAKEGINRFEHYMLRLGGRYLEVCAEEEIQIDYVGVLPQYYGIERTKKKKRSGKEGERFDAIYDLCVRTLELCMMEHYVDTPWREQCLYAFDSRNQMLCGYYAFEGGNAAYARANLRLISKDRRADGLLSICAPCGADLTIPSFSLHFITAVKEYVEHTGDIAFLREIYPKLSDVFAVFARKVQGGLIAPFAAACHWNFYDWSDFACEEIGLDEAGAPDLFLNCFFILAAENTRYLCEKLGEPFAYGDLAEEMRCATRKTFYSKKHGAFTVHEGKEEFSALANALAVLSGVAVGEIASTVCEKLARGDFADCSLSMKIFKYDALLLQDREKYRTRVLEEILKDYGKMLDSGATSVWETIDGAEAFGGAGSLCHGWSAVPVKYLDTLA